MSPTRPAPNRIAGTVIGPAAFASWGYQALVRLTPDQVNLLLDPTRTLAIRNVSTFDLDPANAPVRRLFRFGDDFSSQLRTQGAHLRNVAVTVIPPAGDPRSFSSSTTPALADLAPGASVGIDVTSTTPGPAARDPKESDAAYLARLRAFDRTLLVGAASATGLAGIGRILGAQRTASATRHLPVVSVEKTGPVEIEAGSTAAYQLALQNVGSVAATALGVADTLSGGGALPVTGAPAALDAGATASASASYAVPANTTVQTLDDRGTVSWSDAAGNHYGPLGDDFSSKVIAKRKLSVIKTAEVIGDPGSDQQIRYEISVTDLGDQPVSNVVLTDTIDPYTDLLPDTVTATQGSIPSEVPRATPH